MIHTCTHKTGTGLTSLFYVFFFFNATATTEIYTLSLHDALPIYRAVDRCPDRRMHAGRRQCRRTVRPALAVADLPHARLLPARCGAGRPGTTPPRPGQPVARRRGGAVGAAHARRRDGAAAAGPAAYRPRQPGPAGVRPGGQPGTRGRGRRQPAT